MSTYFYDPDCQEALEHVRKRNERLTKALREIEKEAAKGNMSGLMSTIRRIAKEALA